MVNKNNLEAITHHSNCMKLAPEISFLEKSKYRAISDPNRVEDAELQGRLIDTQKEECFDYQELCSKKERETCKKCPMNPFNESYEEHFIYKGNEEIPYI